ncbi:flippase [Rhodoferax sp.]|uniref:lipopolysaccharide biosynthesis protein n=1 Tax=Rhodoferax sp. TaxID=50421 RepID=UPI002841D114|nr:flippase [Rhodoferax sp.]MDR3371569.1 flippase [Rhodoferax sp.]
MNFVAASRYLRLTPFDTRTEQGRRDERYRVAALSVLANIFSRAVGVALTLLSVSLTVSYLGVERFGVWMTVASFAGMLTFLDLGVGNALTNHVARRAAEDDADLLRQTISGGLVFLALIGLGMGLLLWLIAANLSWGSVIKVDQPGLLSEARQAAMCFALLFGLNIFTSGIQRVFAGLQQAYLGHLVAAFGSLVACIGLWFAAAAHQGIAVLLTIMLGAQSAAGLILLGFLALRKQFSLRGLPGLLALESRQLFKAGGLFFLLQIGTMVGWGADSLIISSTLGASQVAVFSVVQRLFQFATQPLSILNAPLWGAYADAHVRHDKVFIRGTLRRSLTTTLAGAVTGAALLMLFHSWLIEKWTHGNIAAPLVFVAAYAVWVVLDACGNAFAMFLNGTGIVRQQASVVILFIVLVLPMKLIFIQDFGLIVIPIATIMAYMIANGGLYGFVFRSTILNNLLLK